MTWQPVGKYARRRGNHQIGKYYVLGKPVYMLWRLPREWLSKHDTFEDAIDAVETGKSGGLETIKRLRESLAVAPGR